MNLTQKVIESLAELKRIPLRIRDINNIAEELRTSIVEELRTTILEQQRTLGHLQRDLARTQQELHSLRRASFLFAAGQQLTPSLARLITEFPVAVGSADHQFPRGAVNDNTRCPRFVSKAEDVLGKGLEVLDLGCAGGGLVMDFLQAGHDPIGIEGSDVPKKRALGEWALIPDRLFTADITKPFHIVNEDLTPRLFDLVTAWEVLEHIGVEEINGLLDNVSRHLRPSGIFAASVATFEDFDSTTGAVFHVTVRNRQWWIDLLSSRGFQILDGLFAIEDFPRGSGNPLAHDWNARTNPELGFHIVARTS